MTSNRRLGHTCYLQGSCTTTTERVAGVVCWLTMEVVSHPAAHMADEGGVSEWSSSGTAVKEVWQLYAAKAGREVTGIRAMRGEWAELVVAPNDRHDCGDERCLGEGYGEADAV